MTNASFFPKAGGCCGTLRVAAVVVVVCSVVVLVVVLVDLEALVIDIVIDGDRAEVV